MVSERDDDTVIWLGDESTYEVVDWEGGPVIQVLSEAGIEAAASGIELKAWTSEEYKRYVKEEVALTDLLQFWHAHHSINEEEL